MDQFMKTANEEAVHGSQSNDGGPFGAVIVRAGKVIARGHNEVVKTNDPTAHAEMVAIRKAAALLGRFDLSDCEIYSSCEPCPMCLSAIYWSRMGAVYYGCTREDAADIGFDDNNIYEFIKDPAGKSDTLKMLPLDRDECILTFKKWQEKQDKVIY